MNWASDTASQAPRYTLSDTGSELTHQQLQRIRGLAELKGAPKLSVSEKFDPTNFRVVFAWVEALAERITGA